MIKKIAFIVILFLSSDIVIASNSDQNTPFKIKPGPPPGFELLQKNPHQDTYISLFYNGRFVTNAMADFDETFIQFKDSRLVLDKIPHLNASKKSVLLQTLAQKIPTHASLLCPYARGFDCHSLAPEVLGVIFDADNYRADLFINPDYLDVIRHDHDALPNSNAGFSFLSQNIFQATKIQGFKGATWGNTSIFGEGNNELSANLSYTESWTQANSVANTSLSEARTQQLSVNNVTASRYEAGLLYQLGMVSENSGEFFNSQTLGGINIQNYGIFSDLASEVLGSPLIVYLPMPATVLVKKGGQILAAVSLPAGKQALDTSTFPMGSYNVDITVTTQSGQISTQTQFYVKQTTLPDYGTHNFDLAFGLLQKTQYNASLNQTLSSPSFFNIPIFAYYDMRKIGDKLGLSSSLMSSGTRTYLSEVLHLYRNNFDWAPGLAVSSEGDSGIRLGAEYFGSWLNLNLQSFKIWPKQAFLKQKASTMFSLINQSASTFYPLPSSSSQLQFNTSFFKGKNQLSLGAGLYENFDGSRNKTENMTYTRMLLGGETGNLSLGLSLTHQDQRVTTLSNASSVSQEDTMGLASLTYNFFTAEVNGNAILKLSNEGQNLSGHRAYQPGILAALGHSSQSDLNHAWAVSVEGDHEVHYQSVDLSFNGTLPLLSLNASIRRNLLDQNYGENSTQYTASLQSTIAYAGGHFALGNNQSYSTGIVVEVDAPTTSDFSLYDNDYFLGRFKTNHAYSLFVQPYKVHRFTIQPNTQELYYFEQNPKEGILYQGNVEYLHWTLEKQYILFAKVLDKSGKPLANYLLDNQGEYDSSDDLGYVQAGLTPRIRSLSFVGIRGDRCVVTLPKDISEKISGNVLVLEQALTCEPATIALTIQTAKSRL